MGKHRKPEEGTRCVVCGWPLTGGPCPNPNCPTNKPI